MRSKVTQCCAQGIWILAQKCAGAILENGSCILSVLGVESETTAVRPDKR